MPKEFFQTGIRECRERCKCIEKAGDDVEEYISFILINSNDDNVKTFCMLHKGTYCRCALAVQRLAEHEILE